MKLYIILIFVFLLITFVGIVYVDIGYTNPEKFLKDLNYNYINQWIVRLDTNIPNQNFQSLNCEICTLTFVGDVGLNNESKNTIENILNQDADAILFAGDIGYTNPEDWLELTEKLDNTKVFPALGNHEVAIKYSYTHRDWLSPYGITNSYYSISNEFMKIIVIDTELLDNHNFVKFNMQKQFIINELKDNPADFEIILMHRPMYSDSPQKVTYEYRNELQPIFDEYDVELVIAGHDHKYVRYPTISYDDQPSSNGQVYITVGTGGHSLYPLLYGDELEGNTSADFRFAKEAGILRLEINNNTATGQFITNSNEIIDEFVISKIK